MSPDYTIVTETPGIGATAEQMERLRHRYGVAAPYCSGKKVLEVACGSGIGLGYLARSSALTVGGDYMGNLVKQAANHRSSNLEVLQLDAHALPFKGRSFDTVVLFEALYYLQRPELFIQECARVLSPEGVLVVGTVNKEWSGFNPSPYSHKYYSAVELRRLLVNNGFRVDVYSAFPASSQSLVGKGVSIVRRIAVALHLIPRSMKGKELLKRIFYGRLKPLPAELEGGENGADLTTVPEGSLATDYKILYVVGRRQRSGHQPSAA